jgi:hypothetical protein
LSPATGVKFETPTPAPDPGVGFVPAIAAL